MPDQHFDIVVIGAGIVGLSTAMHLAQSFPRLKLAVIEKESGVARHQSSHNSGVIHSGIYYKPGSLKARLCVEGAAAMKAFCRDHGLPMDVCGKVIVATTENEAKGLHALLDRGRINGLDGLQLLDREHLLEHEPHCGGIAALLVPMTGITDYPSVTEKYAEIFQARGGALITNAEVIGLRNNSKETIVHTRQGDVSSQYVINCAGLFSDRVGRMAGHPSSIMVVPFRGEYYDLVPSKQHLVRGLIYPVPDPRFPFLGVHFTRRVHGGVDAGPNAVLALKREGYRKTNISARDVFDEMRFPGFWRMASRHWRAAAGEYYRSLHKAAFVKTLRRLLPEITSADLVPAGSGVRAQALKRDGLLVDDFQFVCADKMLHVYNVPSPAATASLVVGRAIVQMAQRAFDLVP
ncbi:MAG TPA: L-2-hydroxyglutarate oxidase [Terriglobales bacterium]